MSNQLDSDFPRRDAMPSGLDIKMISAMRVALAISALAITYIDPSEPARLVVLTYIALIAYAVYSLVVYVLSAHAGRLLPLRYLHWIDLAWYLGLVTISGGTNSIFFFFLFFAILVASFWWGFKAGLRVAITAAVLFMIIAYLDSPREIQLNRLVLRSVDLLVLGYLIAYWGGYEVRLKRRLQFLRDINQLSNPRFGIGRTTSWIMSRFRDFYKAETCLVVIRGGNGSGYTLKRVSGPNDDAQSARKIGKELSDVLLLPGSDQAVIYRRQPHRVMLYDIFTGDTSHSNQSIDLVGHAIDATSFLSVPVHYRREPIGRLYLIGLHTKFNQSDIEFIIQAIDQVIPVLDNIRLVDELASDAAEQERQKIARDIHDGIIQPYIGLKLGLAAIRQKLAQGDDQVLRDVDNLSDLVLKQIADCRDYIGGLQDGERDSNALVPALRRFAARFSQATGIEVTVTAPSNVRLNDRLAAELFHMVTEGLSNIRRHTHAQRAAAELILQNGHVILQIENENPNGPARTSFQPRSLAERAEALGGELTVFSDDENRTIVNIQIPL